MVIVLFHRKLCRKSISGKIIETNFSVYEEERDSKYLHDWTPYVVGGQVAEKGKHSLHRQQNKTTKTLEVNLWIITFSALDVCYVI